MIKIVTAEINSGKTTWMRETFRKCENADGFVCVKTFRNDFHIGYNLVHLRTGITKPFIRKPEHLEAEWQESFRIRNSYSFHAQGFEFAWQIADQALKNQRTPFFLDEIGPLELNKNGFYDLFKRMLHEKTDMIIAVRKHLLGKVIEAFCIEDFEIIEL
jgi:nucleoside-triphosphatase THEP1